MPRSRKKTAPNTSTELNQTNTTQGVNKMSALSSDQIAALLADSRGGGGGEAVINAFLEGGNAGEPVDLTTGPLAGKEVGKAYTTLVNARKKTRTNPDGSAVLANPAFKSVKILKRNLGTKDDPNYQIFLIDTSKVEL